MWNYWIAPPVNGDLTSVNDDGKLRVDSSDLSESNGAEGDHPAAEMAVDRAPKAVSFPAFRWSFTAKTKVSGGVVGQKWKLVTWGVEPSQ